MKYVAEVLRFSGRSNPRFVLTDEDGAVLQRLTSQLVRPAVAQRAPRLGDQGTIVHALVAGRVTAWLHVDRGVVTAIAGPHAGRSYHSPEIERFLDQVARREGIPAPSGDRRSKEEQHE